MRGTATESMGMLAIRPPDFRVDLLCRVALGILVWFLLCLLWGLEFRANGARDRECLLIVDHSFANKIAQYMECTKRMIFTLIYVTVTLPTTCKAE